jgi:hypothetical protein
MPCSEMIDRHSFERTKHTTSLGFCVPEPLVLFILRSNDENPKRHSDWRIPDANDHATHTPTVVSNSTFGAILVLVVQVCGV